MTDTVTLVIPTYNRPRDLERLLTYLARQAAAFPILVLDSSHDDIKAGNAAVAASRDLNLRHLTYPSPMAPWEKFWRGADEVVTEFCSLCADDDVVLLDSLPPLVEFLRNRPDFMAAHGWYFSFYDSVHLGITAIVYSSQSIDADDPLWRLRAMFNRYEAVTYALYRTDALRHVLRQVQPVESMLARELLAGALTVVSGKVGRLPALYYGRSLAASEPYEHWHPVDFLVSSPEQMFKDYARYREILLEGFYKIGYADHAPAELLKVIDLVHTKYFTEYVSPEIMNYLIDAAVAGTDRREIMRGYWPLLMPAPSPEPGQESRTTVVGRLRARLARRLPAASASLPPRASGDRTIVSTTAAGVPREYRLYGEFLSTVSRANLANPVEALIRALNAY